ncbi:MAG: hypothetical protein ACK5NG_03770 [Chthoniobacterales bacterium]
MKSHFFLHFAGTLAALLTLSGILTAQEKIPNKKGKEEPSVAYIKILNACDTNQSERWKTGLNLTFNEETLGSDVRIGEIGLLARVSSTSKDELSIFRSDVSGKSVGTQALEKIPAKFQEGGLYTAVVLGDIEENSANLQLQVLQQYPIPPQSKRPGKCRVVLLNAISKFPVSVDIAGGNPQQLAFNKPSEFFINPGEVNIGLNFKDKRGKDQRIQSGLVAQAGGNIIAVVLYPAERGDRPTLRRFDVSQDLERVEQIKATQEELAAKKKEKPDSSENHSGKNDDT